MLICGTLLSGFDSLLYLASQSPRRRQLLDMAGVPFRTVEVEVPEMRAADEPPQDYVSRVAREKAGAGLLKLSGVAGAVVLGADTEVVLDDDVFGKPRDTEHAAQMLRRLSGRVHRVISAVWVIDAGRE
jgi:septum formation protein